MDLGLGPIAAGIAGGVLYQLVGNAMRWRPEVMVRRAMLTAFVVVLSILAVSVYLSITTANTDLALRLDNTETRLTHMEQIIRKYSMLRQKSVISINLGLDLKGFLCLI
jgi:hypothetical protein